MAAFVAGSLALALDSSAASDAADQSWQAFVLVAGLLLVGVAAADDGLFDWCAAKLDAIEGSGRTLFFAGLVLVAATTALLNLDTAVVFLTPVMIAAARRREVDERPFLYGTIFMVNAASLFLPGSNLTNLIVIGDEHVTGSEFARRMLPAAIGATLMTALAVWVLHRDRLQGGDVSRSQDDAPRPGATGSAAAASVALLMVLTRDPAVPVLIVGVLATLLLAAERRLDHSDVIEAVNPVVLAAVFSVAVALGTLARDWSGPSQLMADAARVPTAVIGAVAAVLVNNLPAAALLSAEKVHHSRALLVGLNLGPNLAVTGSLSAFLWLQTARNAGATPSIKRYSQLGAIVAPAGIAGALVALYVLAPGRL